MATTPGRGSSKRPQSGLLARAGQGIIQEAAIRLAGQGRDVRAAKLPSGKDWCDVLDTYEERAGILEFDFEQFRPEAEALARREAINE